MYDLVTIGDIKLDTFIVIPDASVRCNLEKKACKLCIEYGKKIPVDEIRSQIAGSAPNVAISLAKMRKKTAVVSVMGKDITYHQTLEFLKAHKVSTRYIKTNNHKSSFAAVLNFKGESTQLVSHGNAEFRFPKTSPKSRWIHVSELGGGYEKLYVDLESCAKRRGTKLSVNPGEIQIRERKRELMNLLKCTELLFLNRREAKLLLKTKTDDVRTIMEKLKGLGPSYVIVTDGKQGAYAYDGTQLDYAPMFPGKRKEATGAGDAFAAGFLGAMIYGRPHREALMWGSVNAASVVQFVGPTEGLLTHTEIKRQLKARPRYKTKEL